MWLLAQYRWKPNQAVQEAALEPLTKHMVGQGSPLVDSMVLFEPRFTLSNSDPDYIELGVPNWKEVAGDEPYENVELVDGAVLSVPCRELPDFVNLLDTEISYPMPFPDRLVMSRIFGRQMVVNLAQQNAREAVAVMRTKLDSARRRYAKWVDIIGDERAQNSAIELETRRKEWGILEVAIKGTRWLVEGKGVCRVEGKKKIDGNVHLALKWENGAIYVMQPRVLIGATLQTTERQAKSKPFKKMMKRKIKENEANVTPLSPPAPKAGTRE